MTINRAYAGETPEKRLRRFQDGGPDEIIYTLIDSIKSLYNNEISAVFDNPKNRQTALMLLGIHSVALTLAYGLFREEGESGYRKFLETFVDGISRDKKFSLITNEIHEWRNVLAHRWLNVRGHQFGYNFQMSHGWRKEGGTTFINPKIYLQHYLRAFEADGRMYRIEEILSADEMKSAKQRLLSKYVGGKPPLGRRPKRPPPHQAGNP